MSQKCRTAPTTEKKDAAIAFTLNPKISSPKINEHFVIHDCNFDGPYKIPIRLSDPSVIQDVVLRQNTPSKLIESPK